MATDSIPALASRCESIRPAGPAPTMPTVVLVGCGMGSVCRNPRDGRFLGNYPAELPGNLPTAAATG